MSIRPTAVIAATAAAAAALAATLTASSVASASRQDPQQLNPRYDSGDHLHPDDASYRAIAASIDLGDL